MHVGPVIIIFESTYKDWNHDYNKSMTVEGHSLVQTHHVYPALKATNDEVNNYIGGRILMM